LQYLPNIDKDNMFNRTLAVMKPKKEKNLLLNNKKNDLIKPLSITKSDWFGGRKEALYNKEDTEVINYIYNVL
jgi:hypothetical protein